MNKHTQMKNIRKHLESGRPINPLQALNKYGCLRLAARVYDLKHDHNLAITKTMKTTKTATFAEYRLVS